MSSYNSAKFQKFLDQLQYTAAGVKRYEWIFGQTFLSPGGLKVVKELIPKLGLQKGQKVLDIGSGLGGHDFYMAGTYGVTIDAIDLSENMMNQAVAYYDERPSIQGLINFRLADISVIDLPEASYDVIYSRDTLLHIQNKPELFKKFIKWLKPGGRIVFTDYAKGEGPYTEEFLEYVRQRNYELFTRADYETLLKQVGFKDVEVTEIKEKFIETLQGELKKLYEGREDFLAKFTLADFQAIQEGWLAKIKRATDNCQTWVLAIGHKEA